MVRVYATILASFFLCTGVIAQEFSEREETAYVIEVGMVSYDRSLPASVIRAFKEEMEARGELVSTRHSEITDLAYKQKAVEIGRIALTFILSVGDQSTQQIKTPDSSIMAQVRVLSADDDSVTASTSSQFAGKIVGRGCGGGGGSPGQGQKIPLDDKEHFTGGGGSFVYFPNGGGQAHAQRRYVRARVAKPEDFEKQKLDPQLPIRLLARGQADAPRFLVLDERWSCLRLATPAEYDGYSTVDKLDELLRVKMEQELVRVKRICKLDENQTEKLEGALLRHRARVQKEAFALEEAALRSPRLRGVDAIEYRNHMAQVNESLHQSYFTLGSFTATILQSRLDDDQLKNLSRATLDEFVNALAGSELNWDEQQIDTIRSHLEGIISESPIDILDHQLLLDALTEEFLSRILDNQQLEKFLHLRGISDKAHYFLLNALQ